ncbi:S-layer homology domain-containing protein [Bengtsoniella intestinalis]|uniref:S-layer homology domain-containing protein n=1 Tax=Bengtsoniella intestinalis TaxID=3073143 RepID=UPI00391F8597
MKKRLLATLLTLCMVIGLLPTVAFAEGVPDVPTEAVASGYCGDTEVNGGEDVIWYLIPNEEADSYMIDGDVQTTYKLVITGTGVIADGSYDKSEIPWAIATDEDGNTYNVYNVEIQEGVTYIGYYSFCVHSNIGTVSLPSTLASMDGEAFFGARVGAFEMDAPSDYYKVVDGVLFSADGRELVHYNNDTEGLNPDRRTEYAIPEGVEVIGSYAFQYCNYFESLTFPSTLLEIGTGAFRGIDITDGIYIDSDTLTTIGWQAFYNNWTADYIYQVSGNLYLDAPNLESVSYTAFYNWFEDEDETYEVYLNIPTITAMGTYFHFDRVTIGPDVTTIESQALRYVFSSSNNISADGIVDLRNAGDITIEGTTYAVGGSYGTIIFLLKDDVTFDIEDWISNDYQRVHHVYVSGSANVTRNSYSIIFDTNGGTYDIDDTVNTESFIELEREGYVFDGWYTEATFENKATGTPARDNTYYAKWTGEITFDANTGDGTMSDQENVVMGVASTITAHNNTFTKTGYTFAGWNTAVDGTGTAYADEASITPTESMTLYAQWTANSYTIAFDANGGTGDTTGVNATYDISDNLTTNGFTLVGNNFIGWATASDGEVAYADGQPVKNLTDTKEGSVTLYAVWSIKDVLTPTVEVQSVTYTGAEQSYEIDGFDVSYLQDAVDVTPIAVGSYDVVLSAGETADNAAYYAFFEDVLVITSADQSAITFTNGNSVDVDDTLTLAVEGGSGTGAVTYAVEGAAATLADGVLTGVSAGMVTVTATKAADSNYNDATATMTVFVVASDAAPTVDETDATIDGEPATLVAMDSVTEGEESSLTDELPTGYTAGDTFHIYALVDDVVVDNATFDSSVTITVSYDVESGKTYQVLHLNGSNVETLSATADVTNQTLSFSVSDLSAFMVVSKTSTSSSSSGTSYYSSTVASTENGDVSISATRSKLNATVTITTTPDDGYEVGDVSVTYSSSKEVTVTDNGDGTYSYSQPGASVTVTVTFVSEDGDVDVDDDDSFFIDVDEDVYYYDAVVWAVENGITSGTTDTTFSPNNTCTRAQAVTFLWRAAGEPEATMDNPFSDLDATAYYYDAVLWAVENGITTGYSDGTFRPDTTCNRGAIVTFLYRLAGEPVVTGETLSDVAEGAYYYDAVLWAVENGITTGYSDGTFQPATTCNRGAIVTFLYRYLG